MAAVGLAEKVKYDEHLKDANQEPQPLPADLVPKEHGDPKNDIAHQHFPTEEERQTLRRVPEKLSWAIFSIGVCELAERFSFYGVTQVFTNYISRKRPFIDGELSSSGARSTCRDRQVLWAWAQRLRMALSLSTSSGVILRPYWVHILLMSTLGAITLYALE